MDEEVPMMMENDVAVGFAYVPKPDKTGTAKAGYPVFKDMEYVHIKVPGDEKADYFQPATDEHKARFPNAYAAFKSSTAEHKAISGMPIEQWAQVTRAQAMTFKAASIPTVEALAAVHDGNIGKLGHGGREWRAKAQAFLAQAKEGAKDMALVAENNKLREMIEGLQQQINALGGSKPAEKPDAPRRGRPPGSKNKPKEVSTDVAA